MENKLEAWLRGPVAGVPAALQPVAHALIQANEEIHATLGDFPDDKLWDKPAEVASVGFHLQHIPGVLDRLFTYAKGEPLDKTQLKYLSEEGLPSGGITKQSLLNHLDEKIRASIEYLKTFNNSNIESIYQARGVGRKQLPSTVLGLLFHSAEHTMRHTGQLLVTARILHHST